MDHIKTMSDPVVLAEELAAGSRSMQAAGYPAASGSNSAEARG